MGLRQFLSKFRSSDAYWVYRYDEDVVSWPPPEVSTLEQFNARFRNLCSIFYLLPDQKEWLELVSAKLGRTEKDQTYWIENDIAEFLTASFPALSENITAARPLLLRTMLRLGSFPYLNRPAPALTPDVLHVALSILLQRYLDIKEFAIGSYRMDDEAQDLRALLFQSMRLTTKYSSPCPANASNFLAPEDSYIARAWMFIKPYHYRFHATNPKWCQSGAPLVYYKELPSSQSDDYSGGIPKEQLIAFLKICSALGAEDGRASKQPEAALGLESSGQVGWEEFQDIIKHDETTLLNGMALFFTPFVSPATNIKKDAIQGVTRAEVLEMRKKAGPPTKSARYDK